MVPSGLDPEAEGRALFRLLETLGYLGKMRLKWHSRLYYLFGVHGKCKQFEFWVDYRVREKARQFQN